MAATKQKKTLQPARLLGKILFPRQPAWQQQSKASVILWAMTIGILTGGTVAIVMLTRNAH